MQAWLDKLNETFIATNGYQQLLEGLKNTFIITLGALCIGVVIGNELIALFKETAVAGYVAVVDLTRAGNLIRNNTYEAFNPLMVVALTYLIIVVILTRGLWCVERRLSKSDKR